MATITVMLATGSVIPNSILLFSYLQISHIYNLHHFFSNFPHHSIWIADCAIKGYNGVTKSGQRLFIRTEELGGDMQLIGAWGDFLDFSLQ